MNMPKLSKTRYVFIIISLIILFVETAAIFDWLKLSEQELKINHLLAFALLILSSIFIKRKTPKDTAVN